MWVDWQFQVMQIELWNQITKLISDEIINQRWIRCLQRRFSSLIKGDFIATCESRHCGAYWCLYALAKWDVFVSGNGLRCILGPAFSRIIVTLEIWYDISNIMIYIWHWEFWIQSISVAITFPLPLIYALPLKFYNSPCFVRRKLFPTILSFFTVVIELH